MAAWVSIMSNALIWITLVHAIILKHLVCMKAIRSRWRTKIGMASIAMIMLTNSQASALGQSPTMIESIPVRWLEYGSSQFSSLYWNDSELPDGSHGEVWMFEGQADDHVKIIMRAASFDAFLV